MFFVSSGDDKFLNEDVFVALQSFDLSFDTVVAEFNNRVLGEGVRKDGGGSWIGLLRSATGDVLQEVRSIFSKGIMAEHPFVWILLVETVLIELPHETGKVIVLEVAWENVATKF